MSTYNGEKYLRDQVDSVLNQDGVDVDLLIRDDGSNDGTLGILDDLKHANQNISVITGPNCKSAASFMALIYEAGKLDHIYDYYAFCDQDDVWCQDKLISAVGQLDECPQSPSALYLGAYQMVDADLRKIDTPVRPPLLNLKSAIASNAATGCTMVFNRNLLLLLASKKPQDFIMHDYWAYLVCLVSGGHVVYDAVPHILYRQHGHNVIGGLGDGFIKRWIVRIRKVFCASDSFKSKLAGQLLSCYADMMSSEDRKFLERVATCRKLSSKLYLLATPGVLGRTFDKKLQMIGLIITGKL